VSAVGRLRRTARALRARLPHGDDGQTMILAIGCTVLALLLVTAVVSATGVHLERKRLLATADALAAEAADALPSPAYYRGTAAGALDSGGVALADADVRRAVDAYLADNPEARAGYVQLVVLDASTPDGRTARVRLGAVVRPTLASRVTEPWADGITLEVEASARAW